MCFRLSNLSRKGFHQADQSVFTALVKTVQKGNSMGTNDSILSVDYVTVECTIYSSSAYERSVENFHQLLTVKKLNEVVICLKNGHLWAKSRFYWKCGSPNQSLETLNAFVWAKPRRFSRRACKSVQGSGL